jgi:hypothetical protein
MKPIDAHVIALDETNHYFIDPKDKPFIKQIRGVYLYDANQHTYCCEFTPSYWLMHLYDQVILSKEGEALDEFAKDEIYQKYEFNGGEDIYVHCHTIDALVEKAGRWEHHHYGSTGAKYKDSNYDEQIDGLREHLCCDCVI